MRKLCTFVILVLYLCSSFAAYRHDCTCRESFLIPSRINGYPEPSKPTTTPSGFDCHLVIMVIRHGSRYAVRPTRHLSLQNQLKKYVDEGLLLPKGQALLFELNRYLALNQYLFGSITTLGNNELTHLAHQTTTVSRTKLLSPKNIKIYCSATKRTQQSMAAFSNEMAALYPSSAIDHCILPRGKDPFTRFWELYKPYLAYEDQALWEDRINAFINQANSQQTIKYLSKQLLASTCYPHSFMYCSQPLLNKEMLTELYYYYLFLSDNDLDDNTQICGLITPSFIKAMEKNRRIKSLYKSGPGIKQRSISYEASSSLAIAINQQLHQATKGPGYDVIAYIGHKETLLPYLSLLNVNNIRALTESEWLEKRDLPMASNLMIRLLTKDKQFYVQLLYNEKLASLPGLLEAEPGIYPLRTFLSYVENNIEKTVFKHLDYEALYQLPTESLYDKLIQLLSQT